jgi:hypothetical protein
MHIKQQKITNSAFPSQYFLDSSFFLAHFPAPGLHGIKHSRQGSKEGAGLRGFGQRLAQVPSFHNPQIKGVF